MIFKSKQVNLDPEPYYWPRAPRNSPRATVPHARDSQYGEVVYGPRPEFEPTRDPEPIINGHGVRISAKGQGGVHGHYGHESHSPGVPDSMTWAPRRDEFDNPVNRILEGFRQYAGSAAIQERAQDWLDGWRDIETSEERFTLDELKHAAKVLARLAKWKSVPAEKSRDYSAVLSRKATEAVAEFLYDSQTGTQGYYLTSIYKDNWDKLAREALQIAVNAVES